MYNCNVYYVYYIYYSFVNFSISNNLFVIFNNECGRKRSFSNIVVENKLIKHEIPCSFKTVYETDKISYSS